MAKKKDYEIRNIKVSKSRITMKITHSPILLMPELMNFQINLLNPNPKPWGSRHPMEKYRNKNKLQRIITEASNISKTFENTDLKLFDVAFSRKFMS